jgi:hypothetical protein
MSARISVQPTKIDLLKQADDSFKKNARRALTQSSQVLLRSVQYQLRRTKPGGRSRGRNPASAPGEPPAYQTGRLAKSWKRLRTRLRRGYASSGVTSSEKRAFALEYGEVIGVRKVGKAGSRRRRTFNALVRGLANFGVGNLYRVAPRPYLKAASDDAEPEITRILTEVVQ